MCEITFSSSVICDSGEESPAGEASEVAFRNSLWLSQLRSLEHSAVLCWAAQHHSCLCPGHWRERRASILGTLEGSESRVCIKFLLKVCEATELQSNVSALH